MLLGLSCTVQTKWTAEIAEYKSGGRQQCGLTARRTQIGSGTFLYGVPCVT